MDGVAQIPGQRDFLIEEKDVSVPSFTESLLQYCGTCEIAPLSRIQQRHIQYDDGGLLFFLDFPPLFQDFFVIAAQAIDAFDDQGVAGLQRLRQLNIGWPIEVLSALLTG